MRVIHCLAILSRCINDDSEIISRVDVYALYYSETYRGQVLSAVISQNYFDFFKMIYFWRKIHSIIISWFPIVKESSEKTTLNWKIRFTIDQSLLRRNEEKSSHASSKSLIRFYGWSFVKVYFRNIGKRWTQHHNE